MSGNGTMCLDTESSRSHSRDVKSGVTDKVDSFYKENSGNNSILLYLSHLESVPLQDLEDVTTKTWSSLSGCSKNQRWLQKMLNVKSQWEQGSWMKYAAHKHRAYWIACLGFKQRNRVCLQARRKSYLSKCDLVCLKHCNHVLRTRSSS